MSDRNPRNASAPLVAPRPINGITERVRNQYRQFPYPPPEATQERPLFAALDYVRYVLWPGRRDLRGLRVLDAGCGTGSTAVSLAQQYPEIEVVGIDLSEASLHIARDLAARRRVGGNLELRQLPLEDAGSLGMRFDYVISSGVIHHLADPVAGLGSLASVLAPTGGIGLMLYGTYGRQPVYLMQELLRRLIGSAGLEEQAAVARRLLAQLSPAHPFKPAEWHDVHWKNDAGIVDLLLHAQDRSYTVPDAYDLVTRAGLRLVRFVNPLAYEPSSYVADPVVATHFAGLDDAARAAIAELLNGRMRKHVLFATGPAYSPVRIEPVGAILLASRPTRSPLFAWTASERRRVKGQEQVLVREFPINEGFQRELSFALWNVVVLERCDGQRTAAEIFDLPEVRAAIPGGTLDAKLERFGSLLELLAEQEVLLFEP